MLNYQKLFRNCLQHLTGGKVCFVKCAFNFAILAGKVSMVMSKNVAVSLFSLLKATINGKQMRKYFPLENVPWIPFLRMPC